MSIANNIDFGVLSRIDFPLESPSLLEKMLISKVRLYHLVTKVTSVDGKLGRGILHGDLIYFPHEGPEEVKKSLERVDTIEERVKWLQSDLKIMLLGPGEERDALGRWLLRSTALLARPHVIYNHLAIFNKLDEVMRIPEEHWRAVPSLHKITTAIGGDLGERLIRNARMATSELDVQVEAHARDRAADIADVRKVPTDGPTFFSSVAVMSSDAPVPGDGMFEQLNVIKRTMRGEDDSDSDDEKDSGGAASSESYQEKKTPYPLSVHRSRDPCNEFDQNGMQIVEMFRCTFPLRRFEHAAGCEVAADAAESDAKKKWFPLSANGSLSIVQTRHLLLQYTNVPAHDDAMMFVLANQQRRHSMLRGVAGRVNETSFECFVELVDDPDFDSKLQHAIDHPNSKDAKQFMRKVLPLLSFIGQEKPWGKNRRASVLRKLLGMYERFGPPSVFWTVSLDDVHNTLSIRMGFPSASNSGFPSFASECEMKSWEEGGTAQEVKVMLGALRHGEKFVVNGKLVSLDEGPLHRLATENPVATAMAYQRVIDAVVGTLIGLPVEKHRKITDAMLDCVEGSDAGADRTPRTSGKRRAGIFGVPICTGYVTEESGRKALHAHGVTNTAASPALLAKLATRNSPEWGDLKAALETQVRAEVDFECHIVHRAIKVLKAPAPRPSFATRSCENAKDSAVKVDEPMVALSAITLGDHKHHATCHKGNTGQRGCRGGYERGHPVDKTHVVQIVSSAAAKGDGYVLAGNQGAPVACECCRSHWTANTDEGAERPLTSLTLVEPAEVPVQNRDSSDTSPVSFALHLNAAPFVVFTRVCAFVICLCPGLFAHRST
jgi:hypothetical protein